MRNEVDTERPEIDEIKAISPSSLVHYLSAIFFFQLKSDATGSPIAKWIF